MPRLPSTPPQAGSQDEPALDYGDAVRGDGGDIRVPGKCQFPALRHLTQDKPFTNCAKDRALRGSLAVA